MKPYKLAFYGDDFTGSADVMEVLQWSGLKTVLFLEPPSEKRLAEFDDLRAFGVAGWGRTMTPDDMDTELLPALQMLRASGAEFVHYKTCSTFDSSPEIGSIGKALELGRQVFGSGVVPIVIGAPKLGRYQVFGNLFARSGLDTQPFRLDRHPTMIQHPITPMQESDIRLHLAQQTALEIELFDCLMLDERSSGLQTQIPAMSKTAQALLFDVLYPEHLAKIGSILQDMAALASPQFVVGSSGIEYALTEFWAQQGRLPTLHPRANRPPEFGPVDQLVVVTGSCSPVNARQVAWAQQHGFSTLRLDPSQLIDSRHSQTAIERYVDQAVAQLKNGANVLLHTSLGPSDARVAQMWDTCVRMGLSPLEIKMQSGRLLGPQLGRILRGVLDLWPMPRVGVAGGDTSGFVARELGINALEAIAPVAPGSPLCRAHCENALDGIEVFFKGGQVGKDDVWSAMLEGTLD